MSRRNTGKHGARTDAQSGATTPSKLHSSGRNQPIDSATTSKRPSPDRTGSAPAPGLYVVATPIGNAADITLRALDTLRHCDVIACEDTRVTRKLLSIHDIATPTTAYHEHNAARVRPQLLARLAAGERVALVSDAGTPLVSDPGYRLVREAIEAGHAVVPLPGASSPLAALVAAGLPTDRFLFAGFLPPRRAARRSALAELRDIRATLIVLESPHRLAGLLADMAEVLGPREACVAREITKLYEETRRGTLDALADAYAGQPAPKGEIVVVVAPPADGQDAPDEATIDAGLDEALATMSLRDAVDHVVRETGARRKTVYALALARGKHD